MAWQDVLAEPEKIARVVPVFEQFARLFWVVGYALRTRGRLGDIRDHAVAPTAKLNLDDPQPTCPAAPDRAFTDDAVEGLHS
ncbi:MAG TPA: hypothetical protein VFI01_12170 [Gaiellaceae bacterium]|nr:hypothetical protein [Gaiellaceae bacterium]